MQAAQTILIVDDAPELAEAMELVLHMHGYNVEIAETREEALRVVRAASPSVILLDLFMPGMLPKDFLREVRANHPDTEVILVTAATEIIKNARDLGIKHFLAKPFDIKTMLELVGECATARAESVSL